MSVIKHSSGEMPNHENRGDADKQELGFDPDKFVKPGEIREAMPEQATLVEDGFDPDKLIELKAYSARNDSKESQDIGTCSNEIGTANSTAGWEYRDTELASNREDRIRLAGYGKGNWSAETGNSRFRPENEDARRELAKAGVETIEYKNGIPNFAPIAKEHVRIEAITSDRAKNKREAYKELAQKWNSLEKDGRNNWKQRDAQEWAKKNDLEPHECSDGKTVLFVPAKPHQECKHAGGVSEAKCKSEMKAKEQI